MQQAGYLKGFYAAISCLHTDSEFELHKSPVLEPIKGKTPLKRLIERLLSYQLFEKILLLVPQGEQYDSYFDYHTKQTPVVLMGDKVLELNARYTMAHYGIYHGDSQVYAWYYSLLQQEGIKCLYVDSVLRGWVSRDSLLKGVDFIKQNPDFEVSLVGLFGGEGRLLTYDSLKPRLSDEGKMDSAQIFSLGPNIKHKRIFTHEELDSTTFTYSNYAKFSLSYATRQNLNFLYHFFKDCQSCDGDYQEDLLNYCKANYDEFFSKVPHIIWQDLMTEDEVSSTCTLRKCLESFSEIGRLQIVFDDDFLEYPYLDELLKMMGSYNLNYVIQLNPDFDEKFQQILIDHFHTIILKLNEIDVDFLKASEPTINAELAFKNLEKCSEMVHELKKPQLGILCKLPKCTERSTKIVNYWARHYAFSRNGLQCIDGYFGGLKPRVDFVRYINHATKLPESRFENPHGLVVDANGYLSEGIKAFDVDLLDYCAKNGFHHEPRL